MSEITNTTPSYLKPYQELSYSAPKLWLYVIVISLGAFQLGTHPASSTLTLL